MKCQCKTESGKQCSRPPSKKSDQDIKYCWQHQPPKKNRNQETEKKVRQEAEKKARQEAEKKARQEAEKKANQEENEPDVLDRFTNFKELGSGHSGTVFSAYDNITNSTVAIKKIDKYLGEASQQFIAKNIYNEVCILKHLKDVCSQYILCYIEFLEDTNNYYIITEYLGNGYIILYDYIHSEVNAKALTERKIHIIAENLKKGIRLIHSLGVAHRDLSTDNILINQTNLDIKYIDFGRASLYSDSADKTCQKSNQRDYRNDDLYNVGDLIYDLLKTYEPLYTNTLSTTEKGHVKSQLGTLFDQGIKCTLSPGDTMKIRNLFVPPKLYEYVIKTITPLLCLEKPERKIILQDTL